MNSARQHYFWKGTFLLTLILVSCKPTTELGDTIVNITDPASEAITLTVQGWNAFEAHNYTLAVSLFKQATQKNDQFADAYNGLGWSYARLDSLTKSLHEFDVALGQQVNFIDAYAGRSFVSLALGDYNEAITAVSAVQKSGSRFYSFRHDPNVSLNDLLLVKAQSYFLLGNYPSAQVLIDQIDPSNTLDPQSTSYIEDLALEIEHLWATI